MAEFNNPLNNIRIASPCSANWNEMVGDERRRYCGECKLNVYNLSGMSRRDAENLILSSEGRLCVRFYRRTDGTILTKDCPVGWKAIKRRVSQTAAAFASLIFAFLSGIGLTAYFNQASKKSPVMSEIRMENNFQPTVYPEPEPLMGDAAVENMPIAGMIIDTQTVKQEIKKNRKHSRKIRK
ncbi:MAG TPA: hypothetical protein VK892_19155 [Pyrinomonadaceae bacterium]|nr:hypothetical protein [Pyrinomonadaceae bacterium]